MKTSRGVSRTESGRPEKPRRSRGDVIKTAALALFFALVASACEREQSSLELGAARLAPIPSDVRSQLDLARALDAVERGDPDLRAEGYEDIVQSFEGRRYRWTLQLIAPLCRADQCNVLAFDRGGRGLVGQSWMPRLELIGDQRETLLDRCAGKSPCAFEISGRLSKLIASTEQFTSVTFDQVEFSR